MDNTGNTRREFLNTSIPAVAALGMAGAALGQDEGSAGLPTRPLGKTGEKVSILALGGWHIGAVKDQNEAIRIMHAAIDEGLTFFDNAWDYHDGGSETIMGKALAAEGKRDKVFLMTKVCARDRKGVAQQIDESLTRLQTDRIDLLQFHEINYDNDPDWIFEKGGMESALAAQKAGKIRYLGYTGHKDPRIHLKMLPKHAWDTVQMPINVCDHTYRSFVHQVIPEANKRGIAPIGMKSLGGGADHKGRFIAEKVCTVEEALRYSLSQPIASLVSGIDSMDVLKQNLAIVRKFQALSSEEIAALTTRVKPLAGDGRHERFKSTQHFDGPYHQEQHSLTKQAIEG